MSNSIGKNLKLTIFGESHGNGVGAILDGFPAGYKFDESKINSDMEKRRSKKNTGATDRSEADKVEIVSGIFNSYTTGAPITFYIKNKDIMDEDYNNEIIRPSHADYTAHIKYKGYNDYRGGGMFSGRLTAAITAAGSLVKNYLLDEYKIWINSYVKQVGNVIDQSKFEGKTIYYKDIIPVIDENAGSEMIEIILKAKEKGDSIGGKIKTVVSGLRVGVGEPFFESLESEISRMIFSIPSVKAIEFGLGVEFADHYGSKVNDEFTIINDRICTKTNYNGGILGGISSGMPVEFTTTIKPTATIFKEQNTVNIKENINVKYKNVGRHDSSIILRAPIVIENATAIVILDMIMQNRR